MLRLAIIYRPPGGRTLSLATLESLNLLRPAAFIAMAEAQAKADELSVADPVLGRIQQEEAEKLRRILGCLLLAGERPTAAVC